MLSQSPIKDWAKLAFTCNTTEWIPGKFAHLNGLSIRSYDCMVLRSFHTPSLFTFRSKVIRPYFMFLYNKLRRRTGTTCNKLRPLPQTWSALAPTNLSPYACCTLELNRHSLVIFIKKYTMRPLLAWLTTLHPEILPNREKVNTKKSCKTWIFCDV